MDNIQPLSDENIQLTAQYPEQMVSAQKELAIWLERKLAVEKQDASDFGSGIYLHAKKCKWKFDTLYNHSLKAKKRVIYYEKLLSAVNAGYYFVPNFPVTIFAIRTNKSSPKRGVYIGTWHNEKHYHIQEAPGLPETVGEYKNPFPDTHTVDVVGENSQTKSWATDWEEFEFPINMSKPQIMEAYERAQALKVFDQFGILPGKESPKALKQATGDPIIVGQIIRQRGGWLSPKITTFMIAWHLDTKEL